jgi:pimeloyl-ACP methyl ester carboxylesterase
MPTAHLNGIDVHHEIRGSGPRLLFFNGSGATIAGSEILIDRFAEHFEVLVHDQRCLGRTTVTDTVPTMALYAADGAALLDHVGWDSASVFGISFGGMVAQEFGVTFPDRMDRLVLACTSAGGDGGSSYPLHTIPAMPADDQERLRLHLANSRYSDEFLASHPFDQRLVEFAAAARSAPKTERQVRGELLQLEARSHHDVWDRLSVITCPTLVAYGEFDALAPPANSRAIASRVVDSELRGFDGGHAFLFQDRAALATVIDFLCRPFTHNG